MWSMNSSYKERVELSKGPDASLLGYDLGSRGTELSQVFRIGSCRITLRKGGENETSCVIRSYSETVIRLLPGYG
jgi:hypothetical protein